MADGRRGWASPAEGSSTLRRDAVGARRLLPEEEKVARARLLRKEACTVG